MILTKEQMVEYLVNAVAKPMICESEQTALDKLNKLPFYAGLRYSEDTFYGKVKSTQERTKQINEYVKILNTFPKNTVLEIKTDAGTWRFIHYAPEDYSCWLWSNDHPANCYRESASEVAEKLISRGLFAKQYSHISTKIRFGDLIAKDKQVREAEQKFLQY